MEGRRRLPQWSLGGATKVLNTKNGDDGVSSLIKPEKSSNAKVSREGKEEGEESTVKKSRRVGRKKKKEVNEQDEISCVQEDDGAKEKRRTRRDGVGRMKEASDCAPRLKKCRVNEAEPSSSPVEDDNEDLTMEDLIAIAKEFAGDDNAASQDGEVYKAESRYADTIISRNEKPSPRYAETASSHPHSAEETETNIEPRMMTGDPAQDMLDVFLGPLLNKKPLWNEKKTDLVSDEDMVLAREVEKRQKNPVVVGDATIQFTKKKTSLKDKVASLLAE